MSKDKLTEQSTSYSTPPEMHKQTVDASLEGPRIFMHGIGGGGGAVSANTRSFSVVVFSFLWNYLLLFEKVGGSSDHYVRESVCYLWIGT